MRGLVDLGNERYTYNERMKTSHKTSLRNGFMEACHEDVRQKNVDRMK